ncbi:MAG: oxidoreductase FAD/NAD(P)-binding domain protein [Proteobacteria bacterium]|nr:oxidoreductase FAD/NAD(P)-binding domain protein [Pseudomonadota bacterium]
MTALSLFLWIAGGIVVQVVAYLGLGFWRHWLAYQGLCRSLETVDPATGAAASGETPARPAAWAGYRAFRVKARAFEDAAQSVCSFFLVPEDQQALPPFCPGQFLTFRLEVPNAAGGVDQVIRCYSLSDAPQASAYRVSIKRAAPPPGLAVQPGRSSTYFHDQLGIGDLLQVRAPAGHFYLDHGTAPVVLLAGGIGITPLLSMLNWSLAEQSGREIWLFYGVRDGDEVVMRAHLEQLAASHPHFHLRLCVSKPRAGDEAGRDYHHPERISVDLLRRELPLKPYHFYLCGPTPLLESMVPGLAAWGVPEARIHFEAFGPASLKRPSAALVQGAEAASVAPGSELVVSFARSGQQFSWSTTAGNLLDFAEAHGVSVNSGCRAGGCGSCQTRIESGEVSYSQAPDFDPEPGSCLLCMCIPKTSVTLEA